ncbi:Translation initiation factor IF-2 [Acaryochloris thomasi RCC1774]|uniref:Translation initiation factor IF-2 n=1 Tax=Acaryochloris thomasi RCC1774 TaxID=1764569 RepID=A0A2W1J8P2_9CYAN|nr:translation initiation factor IF-2 [Acaryochloris thomasi]PZD70518.1 Translation initiation factor IF-2 [Acaryochloris thomasi RCC1774]
MSNQKVRIYELSRELNLDNKDILAVCDQLDIAVKNHSSTITESEAEKIRKKAVSISTSTPVKPKRPAPPPQSSPSPRKSSSPPKPMKKDRPRKQQILEIRKRSSKSDEFVGSASTSSASTDDSVAKPPAPKPVRPQVSPPVKPKSPGSRVSASSPEPTETRATPPPIYSKPAPQLLRKPAVKGPGAPSKSEDSASPERPTQPKPPVPTLMSQPRRPQKPAPVSAKTADTESEASSSGADGMELDSTVAVLEPKPIPRLVNRHKRPKSKVDDDDSLEDKLGKSSKAAKQKRRSKKTVDDDDEDLLTTDDGTQATVDVSRSLVRPPKPKTAATKQSRPMVTATRSSNRKGRRRGSRNRDRQQQQQQQAIEERPTLLTLATDLTVQELALELKLPETEVIKTLFIKGIAANINQTLDIETAEMVAQELGYEVETVEEESMARKVTEMIDVEDLENLQRRPPVVTIMGHVDHGKTTLLDSIRETKVAQGEAGGITQHIGAYHVDLTHNDEVQQVVFLDTPGHEAFTAMRARGTRVTDIAILVVAADDGVRPQTVEAISHARAAKVPIIVAINKIDKEGAQLDRVRQELTEYELVAEDWGGETIMVPVSALKGENLDALLEMVLLVAEVEDLHANPNRPAKGTVIEAHLDKARGPVASFLIQNGTLKVGDTLVAGSVLGKVRAMIDDRGERVQQAGPSFAVEVLGLSDVPAAGDEFEVFGDDKSARSVANDRSDQQRQTRLQQAMASRRVSLNAFSDQAREGELKELNLILKADVQGSVEAILGSLGQLPQDEVQVRVLLSAPGEISETDVDLAAASSAVIIGFNTSLATGARQAADKAGVDIREYSIIYNLLEDIEGAMEGLLEPELVEEPLGQVEVRAVFPAGRGAVAGCYVQSGKLVRNCRIRVHRNGEVVREGILDSLKRMKEDAREVNAGYECGVGLDGFKDWKEGDAIESFQLVTKRRTLSPASSSS